MAKRIRLSRKSAEKYVEALLDVRMNKRSSEILYVTANVCTDIAKKISDSKLEAIEAYCNTIDFNEITLIDITNASSEFFRVTECENVNLEAVEVQCNIMMWYLDSIKR